MQKLIFAVVVGFLIFSNLAAAQATDTQIQDAVNQYNSLYEKSPQSFKMILGTETIKVNYILSDGAEIEFGAKTADGKITNFSATPYEVSTIALSLDEKKVKEITASADPNEFRKSLGNGINIEGLTLGTKIKMFFAKIIITILSFFYAAPLKAIVVTTTTS